MFITFRAPLTTHPGRKVRTTDPVSINATKGRHWAVRRRTTDPWKRAAESAVHGLFVDSDEPVPIPVKIRISLPFKRRASRRDPHNYNATVGKAIVDGLVAGGLIPDDDEDTVELLDPKLVITPWPIVVVEIEEAS